VRAGLVHDNAAGEARQERLIALREVVDDRGHLGLDLLRDAFREGSPGLGQADTKDSSIFCGNRPLHQAAPLRPVDQARDARLVEPEQPGQVVHPRLAVP